MTYKIGINGLFMFLVRLLTNRLLVVMYLEKQKLFVDFCVGVVVAVPTPELFKGQQYEPLDENSCPGF